MASRLSLPQLPRFDPGAAADRWARSARDVASWRLPSGPARKEWLWQLIWAPFWISSDVPVPRLPANDLPAPEGGPAGNHIVRHLDRLGRRIWIQRWIHVFMRSLWLGVLVGCLWLAVERIGGPTFRLLPLLIISALFVSLGMVFAFLNRPTRRQLARMLDRSFLLDDRILTAVSGLGSHVPGPGERAPIPYLQVADSANIVTELHKHPIFRLRLPVREIVLGIACGLLMAGLFFLRGVGGDVGAVNAAAVPKFTPAAQRLAKEAPPANTAQIATTDTATAKDVQARADQSAAAARDLKSLAQALDDQAVTKSAADAMQQGDYEQAADDIRNAAEDASNMSQAARDGLAQDLDDAASKMSPENRDLAGATEKAADGLREGGDAAKQGMNELGNEVDRTSQQVVSQTQLADQMRQAEQNDANQRADSQSPSDQQGQGASQQQSAAAGQQSSEQNQSGEQSTNPQGADAAADQSSAGKASQGDSADQSGKPSSGDGEKSNEQSQQGGQGASKSGDASGPSGQSNSASSSEKSQGGDNPSTDQGKSSQPSQGSGPGSGDPNADPSDAAGGSQSTESGEVTSEFNDSTNVTEASGGKGQDGSAEPPADPHDTITLQNSPDGSGVQTGPNGGNSALGSGSGAAVSSGLTTQGEIGKAGPDSNRVPAEYRQVVEAYFSDDDGS